MKKVLLVFGTRPEAIKMAPLLKKLQSDPDRFDVKACTTAQHRDILDPILAAFDIVPDYDLDVMSAAQDLYDITRKVLAGMKTVLRDDRPELVLVHGDTTTTFAAALAAFYEQIPVGHVEAGLRTHNMYSPYPEEMNRQLTSRIATFHFAPTALNRRKLLLENVSEDRIVVTGNTVIDALYLVLDAIRRDRTVQRRLADMIGRAGYRFDPAMVPGKMILVTGHRRENFGQGFLNICAALGRIAARYPQVDIVYPVHLNPNVIGPVTRLLGKIGNIHLIDPLDYRSFVYLMNRSYLILTDSGGIQEEAPALGKPALVMREITERPEALEAGTVKLVGTAVESIVENVCLLLDDAGVYRQMATAGNPYGDGTASDKIVRFIAEQARPDENMHKGLT